MSFDRERFEREQAERAQRIEAARPAFERLHGLMHLLEYGLAVPAARALQEAWRAYHAWRDANNQRREPDEVLALAVRVVAETFASQIASAATDEQDAATVRWVLAGLRCPSSPFCVGCSACQTVTAPARPAELPQRRYSL